MGKLMKDERSNDPNLGALVVQVLEAELWPMDVGQGKGGGAADGPVQRFWQTASRALVKGRKVVFLFLVVDLGERGVVLSAD
jgi:hypothetical protein